MKIISKLVMIVAVVLVGVDMVNAKTLSVGSTGADVVALQTWLMANGYPIPLIEQGKAKKGYFGNQTETAVKIYQETKKVNLTGVIDTSEFMNEKKLGSVTGPDTYLPYVANNDVRMYSFRSAMKLSTTTPCAFGPINATSTIDHFSARTNVSTSSLIVWTLAKSTNAFSTTTKLSSFSVTGGNRATMVATTSYIGTGPSSDDKFVLGPTDYLVVGLAGATAAEGSTSLTGVCQARLIEI